MKTGLNKCFIRINTALGTGDIGKIVHKYRTNGKHINRCFVKGFANNDWIFSNIHPDKL